LMPLISRKETEQLFFLKKRTNNLDLARKRTYSLGHLFLSCSFAQNYRSICSTFIPLLPAPPLHGRIEESNFYVCFSLTHHRRITVSMLLQERLLRSSSNSNRELHKAVAGGCWCADLLQLAPPPLHVDRHSAALRWTK
jgi:hypothetical protein